MKSYYKHIIFDLDGTLSDSREGIFKAYFYVIDRLGLEPRTETQLNQLIGPPLQQGFADGFELTGESNDEAVRLFREYYGEKGLFENRLYDGIKELLEDLMFSGTNLYVATSKYSVYASRVLQHFEIHSCFREIAGADYNGHYASKVNLVAGLLQRNGITDPADVILIGDTRYDIEAAAELEMESVGVTYGFSTSDEIEALEPDYIAGSVKELRAVLLSF
ncbi:MAG TPA: HAD hydrolase-like protein [Bacteroidales bacterium]|nr:HAD hydrolase-like protein [Bacteroidales bacterium]